MANNFDSNFTRKVMEKVLPPFEAQRVVTKNVNTQLFSGAFNPNSGDKVDIKRPTDYITNRSATGDLTGLEQDIITGKATATVQPMISILAEYDAVAEALEMGTDAARFWEDMSRRMVIDTELDFTKYAVKNTALLAGTVGEGVDSFAEVAEAGSLMQSTGVPMNKRWNYFLNPYSQTKLAVEQVSLGVNPQVGSALEQATVKRNYAGFDVITATTLGSYASQAGADRVGALSATPVVTYLAAKDTMTQVLAVNAFEADLEIKAGEQIQITGRNRLNLSTRQPVLDSTGAQVIWTATVTADVTLSGTGTGNITVTGPAIFEAGGAYNTVDSSPVITDVVTLLGAASTTFQPNLFFHPDAFAIASVPIKRLDATDTIFTTKDGLQFRITRFSDGIKNVNKIRFDFHPAYGTMNPFFAGQGFGTP
jgi:hypothetical protein